MIGFGRNPTLGNYESMMPKEPKLTWGESVFVDGKQLGSICAITESMKSRDYAVEFPDGSDEQIAEDRLQAASDQDT